MNCISGNDDKSGKGHEPTHGKPDNTISKEENASTTFDIPEINSSASLGYSPEKDEASAKEDNRQPSDERLTMSQKLLSWRYFIVLLLQTSFVVTVFLRQCMPMALVCMVRQQTVATPPSWNTWDIPETDQENKTRRYVNSTAADMHENNSLQTPVSGKTISTNEFDWDSEIEGFILTSSALLAFTGPVLANAVRERIGNRFCLTLTIGTSAMLTFISPVAARASPYFLIAVRILLGIMLRGNTPVLNDTIAWWSPQAEKLTIVSLVYTGVNIGGILNSFFAGYLCTVPIDNGWPFIFYTFGTVTVLWIVVWYLLSSQKPEDHSFISRTERDYIVSHRTGMDKGKSSKPPYRKILTSVPVAACIACVSCHMWSTGILLTYLPKYFNKVLRFSVQETGMLVSLMSACRMIGSLLWTLAGNKIMAKYGTNMSRKICVAIGFTLAGASHIGVAFLGEFQRWVVTAMMVCVMACQAVGSSVLMALPLDMAPRYSGFISGLMSSVASFVTMSGPLMTAAITSKGTADEWRNVWLIMAAVFFTSAAIFTFFGQASLQPWATGAQAGLPHVIPPLVALGRRFTATIEARPQIWIVPDVDVGFEIATNSHLQTHQITIVPKNSPSFSGINRLAFKANKNDEVNTTFDCSMSSNDKDEKKDNDLSEDRIQHQRNITSKYPDETPHEEHNGSALSVIETPRVEPYGSVSSVTETPHEKHNRSVSSVIDLQDKESKENIGVQEIALENYTLEINGELHSFVKVQF